MAISAYILKIVKKDPFLRLQMRAKEKNEAIKHDLVEFKGSMFEGLLLPWQQIYHLAFLFNFRTTAEVFSKLYFVEIC